jgi:phage terminase large subunit GpA-like protein
MLAVTDPRVRKITVMGPTQLLKTELINNVVGYFIDQDPAPMIVMQPTGKMAEAWSKDRLDKMLRDTPALAGRVKDKRSRDSDNTILHKSFPGGHVTVVGSNSPSDLASRPVRVVLCDEVDKYPVSAGKEGDPIKLIEERSDTFWNSLSIRVCSPTIQGRSRIEAEYELSDKRVFCGLCPSCETLEELKWERVDWNDADPEGTAAYVCSHCDTEWSEQDRLYAISHGEYVATAPFKGHAGFHCNKLASPWQPVSVLVRKYLEAKDDPEKLKTWTNTQLAETWVEKGEVPEWKRLYERRELFGLNVLQPGVVFLTSGVDVGKDYLKVEITGWGRDKQSWLVDYRTIMGDTATDVPWLELDKILNESWTAADGRELRIRMMCVDSGFNTQQVYKWVRKHAADRVRAIKGSDQLQTAFSNPKDIDIQANGQKLKRVSKVWPVGVSLLKQELYGWLTLDGAGDDGKYLPGFCHYPQLDEEYFKSLCSEQLMKRKVNERTVYKWVKIHERNEALDCRVYSRAAASMFGIDRMKDENWDALEGKYDLPPPSKPVNTPSLPDKKLPPEPARTGGFLSRQRMGKPFIGR